MAKAARKKAVKKDTEKGSMKGTLSEAALRDWSRILGLWRVCDKRACRSACACRGQVRACVPRNFAAVPEGVRGWFCCLLACRQDGLSYDQALAKLKGTRADEAFHAWHASDEAAAGNV